MQKQSIRYTCFMRRLQFFCCSSGINHVTTSNLLLCPTTNFVKTSWFLEVSNVWTKFCFLNLHITYSAAYHSKEILVKAGSDGKIWHKIKW
jgi:hypothetical protein